MNADMTPEVMHAIGKGVRAMQIELADRDDKLRCLGMDSSRFEAASRTYKEERDKAQAELRKLKEVEPRRLRNLRRLDGLENGLFEYMVELVRQRAVAKTKAESVALGHVIAKLVEMRPPGNKAEADALGLPWTPEPHVSTATFWTGAA